MQCSSCNFQNMPGIANCGRCGAFLRMATMEIDVHPPRASARARRWRRFVPTFRKSARQFSEGARAAADELFGPLHVEKPLASVFWRMLVPGWPQFYCGRTIRGALFLSIYTVLMALAIVFFGSTAGSMFFGFAISCHSSSVLDVVYAGTADLRSRLLYAVVFFGSVVAIIYVPLYALTARYASPVVVSYQAPPFEIGDVLVSNRAAEVHPGDIAHYLIPEHRITARPGMIYAIEGERFDRILAGPGQHVSADGSVLLVDGVATRHVPLNELRALPKLDLTVPDDSFFIFPSTDITIPPEAAESDWRQLCLVPRGSVLGRIYLQSQPRWQWVP